MFFTPLSLIATHYLRRKNYFSCQGTSPLMISIRVHQLRWVPNAVGIRRNARILIRHRVDGEPHRHQLMVHISRPEVAVAGFLVAFFAGEGISFFNVYS